MRRNPHIFIFFKISSLEFLSVPKTASGVLTSGDMVTSFIIHDNPVFKPFALLPIINLLLNPLLSRILKIYSLHMKFAVIFYYFIN